MYVHVRRIAGAPFLGVDKRTGRLILKEKLTENSIGSYALSMEVTDQSGNRDTVTVMIYVTDQTAVTDNGWGRVVALAVTSTVGGHALVAIVIAIILACNKAKRRVSMDCLVES